jgi:hypothetical protein
VNEFRYSKNARELDDALVTELTQHRAEAAERAEDEKQANEYCGLDHIAKGGTPLDQVKAIIESKKAKPAKKMLEEHAVGKKMAEMLVRGPGLIDTFLGSKG